MSDPTREVISGVLHGSVIAKRQSGLLDRLLLDVLTDSGRIDYNDRRFYYAPRYYLTNEGTEVPLFRLWSFKGQPKALSLDLRGHVVTVRATIEYWPHGRGAHLLRPVILEVSEGKATNHHCDSPGSCGIRQKVEVDGNDG